MLSGTGRIGNRIENRIGNLHTCEDSIFTWLSICASFINKFDPSTIHILARILIGKQTTKVLILRDLFTGTKRFGELKKSLTGISQKVLTANLRDMEVNGLLTRKAYAEVPPRVEYTLTEIGESLKPILSAMFDWGMDYKRKNNSPSNELVDALGKALHICHAADVGFLQQFANLGAPRVFFWSAVLSRHTHKPPN